MTTTDEKDLVERAQRGDRAAVEALVRICKDLIYNLAVRMLGDRAEAEDAAQEILIRVINGLATFRGESAFRTWVYRVASNHLLTARSRRSQEKIDSFEALEAYLDGGIAADLPPAEDQVLVREAMLTCTTTMLQCLDRDHRFAYVLGEIFEMSSDEAAAILEVSSDAFRKRLSRARERMSTFMAARCGLVNENAPCRCSKQAANAIAHARLDRARLRWSTHPVNDPGAQAKVPSADEVGPVARVFRGHPNYAAPAEVIEALDKLFETHR